MGASRIDRINTVKELSDNNIGVETVAAAFTENLSVVMRLSIDSASCDGAMDYVK